MSRFLQHASQIFDAANSANGSSELTILIHPEGQIHIVEGADSPIEALQLRHGARTAYRVTREASRVRVEGRAEGSRCVVETDGPRNRNRTAVVPGFLVDCPLYRITATRALA